MQSGEAAVTSVKIMFMYEKKRRVIRREHCSSRKALVSSLKRAGVAEADITRLIGSAGDFQALVNHLDVSLMASLPRLAIPRRNITTP